MDELGLDPSWISTRNASTLDSILELHNIENSLSTLVAAIFWIGPFSLLPTGAMLILSLSAGHITPRSNLLKDYTYYTHSGTIVPPTSFANSTVIQQISSYCRLDVRVSAC
jgi:hypothetical protein